MKTTNNDLYSEAIKRLGEGGQPLFSTGICGNLTCGFGKLDEYGYWEYPLPESLFPYIGLEACQN